MRSRSHTHIDLLTGGQAVTLRRSTPDVPATAFPWSPPSRLSRRCFSQSILETSEKSTELPLRAPQLSGCESRVRVPLHGPATLPFRPPPRQQHLPSQDSG